MRTAKHRLVLWDIDLTLVDLRGTGQAWYTSALAAVTGIPLSEMPSFGGRTERAITSELLVTHGIEPTEEMIQKIWAELTELSLRALPELAERGQVLPGAAAALATMAGRDDVVQTVVTGNLPEVARHKLTAFDLDGHIDFEIGGYGTLSLQRPPMVTHAVELATRKHGVEFDQESVVVIGDTPHDVDAALHHGMIAIGVATGTYSVEELRDSGAHAVLTDLSDTTAVLATVLG
nr:haloacid dehalogenase-like hydrolase [Amycolatopsis nigrescens]